MRQITTSDEMLLIQLDKKGFILNERSDVKKVHHVSCEAVQAMVIREYPKYFSADRAASKDWLDRRFGSDGWENCGVCHGLRSDSN